MCSRIEIRWVYYDQRGTGRSDAPLDSSAVNLDAFVTDIDALRQALGYEQVTLLTHSFGTLFGIEYARRYPESLRGLILMAPVEPGQRFADQAATRQASARTEEDAADLAELTGSEAYQARDADHVERSVSGRVQGRVSRSGAHR